jgi:hypothetical protein
MNIFYLDRDTKLCANAKQHLHNWTNRGTPAWL